MPRAPEDRRVLIVFDGHKWHVRRLACITHDLERNEKIYTADMPIANDLETPEEAVDQAMAWIDHHP